MNILTVDADIDIVLHRELQCVVSHAAPESLLVIPSLEDVGESGYTLVGALVICETVLGVGVVGDVLIS